VRFSGLQELLWLLVLNEMVLVPEKNRWDLGASSSPGTPMILFEHEISLAKQVDWRLEGVVAIARLVA
jgi:hypothetical protein